MTSANGASAVAGIAAGTAFGVYGSSSGGVGVSGDSSSGFGLAGNSSSAVGINGSSESSDFASIQGAGEYYGVLAVSVKGGVGLTAETENSSGLALSATGFGSNAGHCTIDFYGNLKCSGTISGGQSVQTRHRTSSGQHVLAYGSEATSATIEDFGTAHLADGTAVVRIDSAFQSTIDRNRSYYVFLTPLADTRGLYVSAKEPASFTVREVQGGHSQIAFDYRIVAHPLDAGNDRLPPASPLHVPSPQLAKPAKLPALQR